MKGPWGGVIFSIIFTVIMMLVGYNKEQRPLVAKAPQVYYKQATPEDFPVLTDTRCSMTFWVLCSDPNFLNKDFMAKP